MPHATILEYNGIQLRDCQTLRHAETPVYASDGMTLEGMQFSLRVLGYFSDTTPNFWPKMGLNPYDVALLAPTKENAYARPGAGQHYQYLQQFLQTPQKTLKYYVDCVPYVDPSLVLPAQQGSVFPYYFHNVLPAIEIDPSLAAEAGLLKPTYEMSGGPRCVSLDITHMAGNDVWRVEVEYTWTKPAVCIELEATAQTALNPNADVQGQIGEDGNADPIPAAFDSVQRKYGVRSHTWTCYEQVDTNWFTTRTYNGELKISSPHINIHDYRYIVVPPLTPGMKRESIDYKVSADHMTLQYTIVDKEVMVTPPSFFSNININHSESSGTFGALSNIRLDVKLTGHRTTSRKQMLTYALAIIDYKLHLSDLAAGRPDKFATLVNSFELAVSEGTHQDNSLTASVTAQKTYSEKQQVPGQAVNGQWFGFVSGRFLRRISSETFVNTDDKDADKYHNQLMYGNNVNLINAGPAHSGGISIASCFHAAIAEACATNLSFSELADNEAADDTRRALIRTAISDSAPVDIPTAPVQIFDELPTLNTPSQISSQHTSYQYNNYYISTDYTKDALSMSLPSSDTTATAGVFLPSAVFVRVGPEQWRKVVKITAERYGTHPRLPDPEDLMQEPGTAQSPGGDTYTTTAKLKLIKFEPRTHAPQYAPDMSGMIYRTDATYVYAMDRPPTKLRYGIPDTHAASLFGQDTDNTQVYSPSINDVLVPALAANSPTQNAWQVNV